MRRELTLHLLEAEGVLQFLDTSILETSSFVTHLSAHCPHPVLEQLVSWIRREHHKLELRGFSDHPGSKNLSAQLKLPLGELSRGPVLLPPA